MIDLASWAGARLPARFTHGVASVGGLLEWAARPRKRRHLAANIAHALAAAGDDARVARTVRAEFVNEAHRSADLLWALGNPRAFLDSVELDGIEHAQAAADAGTGLILAGTHLGGWEVATAIPGATLSVPTTVVVADDWLAWAIEHARVGAGLRVVYPNGAALACARLLRRGEAVLMLVDNARHAASTAPVAFLDAVAELPLGVATLSRLGQAPVLSFTVLPLGRRRWRVTVDPPLGPPPPGSGLDGDRDLLQALAHRWSAAIAANPEHWSAAYPIAWTDAAERGAACEARPPR